MPSPLTTRRLLQVATASAALLAPSAHAAGQPNILLIMADDVGVEAFSSYGGTSYSTPNLSQLAATGRQYSHAYATPLCTPSRVQLLTGQYNFRNYESFGWLDPDETTFAEVLRNNGYTTAVAGKWQLSDPDLNIDTSGDVTAPNVGPAAMRAGYGFDQYSLWQLNAKGSRYWDPVIEQNGSTVPTNIADYGPDINVDFLNSFMADAAGSNTPFLAYYAMELPHDPWVPTPESHTAGMSKGASSTSNFAANVAYLDTLVGRLVGQLEALGIREETLIVFTSDNGTSSSITSQTEDGPIKGDKGRLTDAGTHVPFIVNWQGTVAGGETTDRLVDLTDVFPTLLNVAGVTDRAGLALDGKALLGQGGAAGEDRDAAYMWYDPKGRSFPTGEWARDQRYKLYADGRFFDTQETPLERTQDQLNPQPGTEGYQAKQQLQAVLDFYAAEQAGSGGGDGGGGELPGDASNVLLRYAFTGDTAGPTSGAVGVTGSSISTVGTNAFVFNANNSGDAAPVVAATGWTTSATVNAGDDYWTFTLELEDDVVADLDALTFVASRNDAGPRNWTVRWSVDGFSDDLASGDGLATGNGVAMTLIEVPLDVQGITSDVTFRIYGFNATSGSSDAFRLDDLVITGAIPEPGTLGLLGAVVGFSGLLRHRHRCGAAA